MVDEFSYIVNDARCLSAMEDLKNGMDTLKWLGEYLNLYMTVTYGPEGYPKIANSSFEGKKYEGILDFVILYNRTHHEYEDPFTDKSDNDE